MHEFDEPAADTELQRARIVVALLDVGGWFVIAFSLVWALAQVWGMGQAGDSTWVDLATLLAKMVAGLAGGVLLWGLSEIVRRLCDLKAASMGMWAPDPAGVARSATDAASSEGVDPVRLEELVVLTREVRDISLLSEEQRRLRLDAQGKAACEHLQREVPQLLREHNWIEARNRVQEARERFPSLREWDTLEKQIEEMRVQVETHDIEDASRQINDLVALAAWERVAEVVDHLLERHPESARAIELAQDVRRRRHEAEAQQRAQLMARAQEAVNQRDWKVALEAGMRVIKRFPKSAEAQDLRVQMPTLRANAEIKARQEMEANIRTLSQQHRYSDALRVARDVIDRYPTSPQASALREKIGRLEQLATAGGRG